MVIGAGCYVAMWLRGIVCWVFLIGAVMFSLMQTMQIYTGTDAVWQGITYKEDKDALVDGLNKLVNDNVYPDKLW